MNFLKKHRVFTAIAAVLLVVICAAAGVVFHFLNKVNYDDGSQTQTEEISNATDVSQEADILNSGALSADEKEALSSADKSISDNLDESGIMQSSNVFNVLLMGIDYGGKNYPYGRSDAMIIASVNKSTKKVSLVSCSRAAYVAIPGYNNTRLNHAHGYGGAALAIKTIENNYKIKIDNYVSVNFASFEKIIDAFGGVSITLTSAEARSLNRKFGSFPSSGTYRLNGKQALEYARTRKIDTDKERTGRQRKVLLALAKKAKAMSLSSAVKMLDTVLPLVTTDFTKSELLRQAANAYGYLKWETAQYVVPHKPSSLVLRGGFEVVLVDWNSEVKYIQSLLYGTKAQK